MMPVAEEHVFVRLPVLSAALLRCSIACARQTLTPTNVCLAQVNILCGGIPLTSATAKAGGLTQLESLSILVHLVVDATSNVEAARDEAEVRQLQAFHRCQRELAAIEPPSSDDRAVLTALLGCDVSVETSIAQKEAYSTLTVSCAGMPDLFLKDVMPMEKEAASPIFVGDKVVARVFSASAILRSIRRFRERVVEVNSTM